MLPYKTPIPSHGLAVLLIVMPASIPLTLTTTKTFLCRHAVMDAQSVVSCASKADN